MTVKVGSNQKQIDPPGELLCPKDSSKPIFALKGGAGYCQQCCLYVQAAGVPMPAIDRPPAKSKAGSKRRPRTARAGSR